MPSPASEMPASLACPEDQKPIGRDGEEVLAITFGGGAFETAIQLGVAHALLVSQGRAPDVVVGIAAGAPNAAALAEILQAGETLKEEERRQARFKAFRTFLNAYQEAPAELIGSLLPDPYEIEAGQPLKLLELPIHHAEERAHRDKALRAQSGLIRLLNDLMEVNLPISFFSEALRRILALVAAPEIPSTFRCWSTCLRESFGLLSLLASRFLRAAPMVARIASTLIQRQPQPQPVTTGEIIHRSRILKKLRRLSHRVLGLIVTAAILTTSFGLLLIGFSLSALILATQAAWTVFQRRGPSPTWKAPLEARTRGHLRRMRRNLIRWASGKLLGRYDLRDALFDSYALRQIFVRLFDPGYYGPLEIRKVIDTALRREGTRQAPPGDSNECLLNKKKLGDYHSRRSPGIFVSPVAADVATGRLLPIPQAEPVVDALLAATAAVPFLPAVPLQSKLPGETFPPVCI